MNEEAELQQAHQDLRSAGKILRICLKRKRWEAAKDACVFMAHVVRKLKLLEMQQKEEA